MRPYSEDLRSKIVAVCDEQELTRQEVADLFHVSVAFVQNVLRRWCQEGQLAPQPHSGGLPATIDGLVLARIERWIARQPDLALAELCARLDRQCGIRVSLATMWRALQRLELPRKKRRCTPRNGTHRVFSAYAGLGGRRSANGTRSAWYLSMKAVSRRLSPVPMDVRRKVNAWWAACPTTTARL